jgi:hypothetical protein
MRHSSIPVWANPNARSWKDEIMAKVERMAAEREQRAATRSSLIKLSHEALRVHVASLAGDVCPRDGEGGSEPLAVCAAALATAVRNQKESSK